jgi:hypothetical protein
MAIVQGGVRFDKIAEKWHALARRRLASIRELERNGRWIRYYNSSQLASHLHEAERTVALWARLAAQRVAFAKQELPPAA